VAAGPRGRIGQVLAQIGLDAAGTLFRFKSGLTAGSAIASLASTFATCVTSVTRPRTD